MNQLFVNGNIYSLTRKQTPYAEAMWVEDGIIREMGSTKTLRNRVGRAVEVDLQGKTVIPSFTDSHIHFLNFGLGLKQLQLEGLSLEQVLDRVRIKAADTQRDTWIVGRGFNFNDWAEGWPKKEWLDQITTTHPVVLVAKDGHMIWVNTRALTLLGISDNTPNPRGGVIQREPGGELTGIFQERACDLILDKLPEPSLDDCEEALARAIKQAHAYGITAVHNMEDARSLKVAQRLRARGDLNFRIWSTIPQTQIDLAVELGLASGFGDRYLRIGGIKIFADGSLGSRTAWMLDPYENTNDRGVTVTDQAELASLVEKANQADLPVVVHGIGDGAVRAVLDAVETKGRKDLRNRLEHSQLVSPEDINRFSKLNVIPSMQPTQCPEDRYMADVYWGERCSTIYPFRRLLDSGARLAFGSDCPVETCNVFLGLYSAVARKRWSEPNSDPWYPDQAISLYEALRAYTIDAAYAGGEEHYRGDLRPNMAADFLVLSQDILASEDPEILKETQILATYFEGKLLYQK